MSLADELQKLEDLRLDGALSDAEFEIAKKKLLQQDGLGGRWQSAMDHPDDRTWGMAIHLSQLAGLVVPVLGWVVPIVIWQVMKDKSRILDAHGRVVTNWLLSQLIYFVVALLLTLVLIGWLILVALLVVSILFPILGGLKAQNGEVWRYPLSIPFFPVDSRI